MYGTAITNSPARAELSQQVAEFLAAGGEIVFHDIRINHPVTGKTKKSMYESRANTRMIREGERRRAKIAERIKVLARVDCPGIPIHGTLRTPLEVRRLLWSEGFKVNSPEIEQIAAKHCILLELKIQPDGKRLRK